MTNPQEEEEEVVNCLGCGRNTRAKHDICGRCRTGGGRGYTGEYADRKNRSLRVIEGSPLWDIDDDFSSDQQYHGPSSRDDI